MPLTRGRILSHEEHLLECWQCRSPFKCWFV